MTDTHIKIHNVVPRVQYVGNGVTTQFNYTFEIFASSNMKVYLGDELQESGYTVYGAGESNGGHVDFTTAPASGVKVTLLRNVPIERITDFQEGGTFRPKNLNDDFDRQTAFCQQVQETLNRAVVVPPTSATDPEDVRAQIDRIYDSIDNVDIVADDIANVNTTATNISNVNSVGGNISNVNAVAGNATNINAVNANKTNINTVAGNNSNITTVGTNIANVNAVGTNISNVNSVAGNATNINNVAGNKSNIDTVAGNKTNINTVAANNSNVTAVGTNISNVNSVASNSSNINACVTNMAAIQAAPTAASNAATSATNSNIWAEGTDAQVQALGGQHSSKGWASVSQQVLPPQSGHTGEFLKTDGTTAGWSIIPSDSTKANDSEVVKLTGNQNISGVKTFSDNLVALGLLKGTTETGSSLTDHAISIGHQNQNHMDFYENGGTFNFYKSQTGTNTPLFVINPSWVRAVKNVLVENTNPGIVFKDTVRTKGTAPSSPAYNQIKFVDLYDSYLGGFELVYNTNKSSSMQMFCSDNTSSSGITTKSFIKCKVNASGVGYTEVTAPTEDTTSSVQIDTVGARNTKLGNYAKLDGSNLQTGTGSGKIRCIKETYSNGTEWYRVWSDGWIEQGGQKTMSYNTNTTVNFNKTFTSTNYTLNFTKVGGGNGYDYGGIIKTKNAGNFIIWVNDPSLTSVMWYACGY